MVWCQKFIRDIRAEIYLRKHSYGSAIDNDCVFCHNFGSQFFISQHIVGFVGARYEDAFDT